MATNTNPQHQEGPLASADLFLWAAVGSMAVSLCCKVMGRNHTALFVGQWAPSLLIMGLYNKLVKLEGHDGMDSE